MLRKYCIDWVLRTIVTLVVLLAASASVLAQENVTVMYDDSRSNETIRAWQIEEDSDALYLRANDVARIFRATQFWNASSRKVVLGIDRTRFTLTVDTRVVVIDGEPVMMKNPSRYDGGFVMIPLQFVVEIAAPYTPSVFTWDRISRTLRVESIGYNVQSITFATARDRSTATITLSEPLIHHLDSSTPGLIRLKLYGGRVDANRFVVRREHGLFNGTRAEQSERDAFVFFDIKRTTQRIIVEREDDPPRLRLILEKGDLPEIPEPDFADRKDIEVFDNLARERRDLTIEKIIIDPGHGGKDHGKIGNDGVLEKDINLAIAMRAAEVIQRELGLEVELTREDDVLISLTRRTEIANESGGDLFISIHCNSWFSAETGGFEAYFLSPARTDAERALEMQENRQVGGANDALSSDIDFILWDLVQNEFINESSHLAEMMQKSMNEQLSIRNRGVKQANFVVLQGAHMPAVLVEAGFLSNPSEEDLLVDPAFQERVAIGIADAVRRFKERYR